MAAAGPIEAAGWLECRIRKAADGNASHTRQDLQVRQHRDAANDAERGFMPPSGRAQLAKRPELALDLDLSVRKEGRVGEGASAAPLAIKARARIDDGRRTNGRNSQGTASASRDSSCQLILVHAP